ncbi:MAG: glycoside hydrolase family 13 protein [Chitinophagaceae bacterium]
MKKFLFVLILITGISTNFLTAQIKAYPSHWWTGMKHNSLQVMLHSTVDLSKSVKVKYPGVVVTKVHQPENKHYLFVDLLLLPTVKAGKFDFVLDDGTTFTYELKSRNKVEKNIAQQGVRSNDLIYLIMPDRFVNGDLSNDQFDDLKDKVADRNDPYSRHGGDLKGVTEKLDYLKDLGVTSIWMTPVLENNMPKMQEGNWWMSGYHGYWITDHYQVDKRLGGNQAYKNLVDEAHSKGLKIIQDAVYNHVGSHHHTVLDLPMNDWLNQWPTYTGANHREELFMDPYASSEEKKIMIGGWFVPHLPDLNLANPYCAKFVIQNNIWSTEEFGIDGWRVDTYKYCDEKFLNDINHALLREYPNLTVFGEAWTNTVPSSAYFTENNLDAPFKHKIKGVTDFPLNSAMYNALNDNFGWTDGVTKLYMTLSQDFLYKDPYTNCIFLDNHDMNRFFSMVGEDLSKYKMGLGLLMTLRGIPQIYYGTEVLMKNYKDPNDAAVRKDFPGGWKSDSVNKFNVTGLNSKENEAFSYFKKLANYRKTSAVLAKGSLKQFIPQNGVYVYFRKLGDQTIMCVANTNKVKSTIKTDRFKEAIGDYNTMLEVMTEKGERIPVDLEIPAQGFLMFELKK